MEDGLDPFALEQLAERLGIGVRADVQPGASGTAARCPVVRSSSTTTSWPAARNASTETEPT